MSPPEDEAAPRHGSRQHVTDTDSEEFTPMPWTGVKAIDHCHAVIVRTPAGREQRRLYLSLHSADRAMQRARARGQEASCLLVTLVPVPGVPAAGAESGGQ
jgi:hypothetical protein